MSSFQTTSYHIQRPTGVCCITGRTLEPGESYIATLVDPLATDDPAPGGESTPDAEREDNAGDDVAALGSASKPDVGNSAASTGAGNAGGGGEPLFRRQDVSLEAWRNGERPRGLFSHWRTVVPEPNQKRQPFVDDQVMTELFKQLEDTTQPNRLAFRFVIALLLMRKKLLKFGQPLEPTPEGLPRREVQLKGADEPLVLIDPQLDDDRAAEAASQLHEILEDDR